MLTSIHTGLKSLSRPFAMALSLLVALALVLGLGVAPSSATPTASADDIEDVTDLTPEQLAQLQEMADELEAATQEQNEQENADIDPGTLDPADDIQSDEPASAPVDKPAPPAPVRQTTTQVSTLNAPLSNPAPTAVSPAPEVEILYWNVPWRTGLYQIDSAGKLSVLADADSDKIRKENPEAIGDATSVTRFVFSKLEKNVIYAEVDWTKLEIEAPTSISLIKLSTSHVDYAKKKLGSKYKTVGLDHIMNSKYYRYKTNTSQKIVQLPSGTRVAMTAAQYKAAGSPSTTQENREFYKLPWASTVWMVVGKTRTTATSAVLKTYGNPTPALATVKFHHVSWNKNSVYAFIKRGASPQEVKLLTTSDRKAITKNKVTFKPTNIAHIPGSVYYRWKTSSEKFVKTPDGKIHKLTAAQYKAAGNPKVTVQKGGYMRLTWGKQNIWYFPDITKSAGAYRVTTAQHKTQDKPTPKAVKRFPGDTFYRYWGVNKIYWSFKGKMSESRTVTTTEYKKAGSPWRATKYYPVFVYGTLRPGQAAWNTYLRTTHSSYKTDKVANMVMYSEPKNRWPFAVRGKGTIVGTVVYLKPATAAATMARLDAYESYNPKKSAASQAYNRVLVKTRGGTTAWMYITGPNHTKNVVKYKKIKSGDWLKR